MARIVADVIRADRLPAVVEALRLEGVRLAYAAVPWIDTPAIATLSEAGARCVDRKVRYRKESPGGSHPPDGIESAAGTACMPDLEQLALASGVHSRFRADAAVPWDVFERLYHAWIRRSLAGEIARDVLVIRDGSTCIGMVTVAGAEDDAKGTIGLIAVEDGHRGQGLGKRLMRGAEAWCAARGMTAVEVATQMRNVAACRLYAACGYEIVADDAVFHLWLEGDP